MNWIEFVAKPCEFVTVSLNCHKTISDLTNVLLRFINNHNKVLQHVWLGPNRHNKLTPTQFLFISSIFNRVLVVAVF